MNSILTKNEIIDGYQLIRCIGQGGFGEVWLCKSVAIGDYRAFKFISSTSQDHHDQEYAALAKYRQIASKLNSTHVVTIEHINKNAFGFYYIMPLADGANYINGGNEIEESNPLIDTWHPTSLLSITAHQAGSDQWLDSQTIKKLICPVLKGLQELSDAGVVHRDVKPENILLFDGIPKICDISLLREDATLITRIGTPGYSTPTWYLDGHPDMYGASATLYHLLTGNSPDKMGRSTFLWPPQSKESLSESEQQEWSRLHKIIRRATEEQVTERYVDFSAMLAAIEDEDNSTFFNKLPLTIKKPISKSFAITAFSIFILTLFISKFHRIDKDETQNSDSPTELTSDTPDTENQKTQTNNTKDEPPLTEEQKADYTAMAGLIQAYVADGKYANALATIEMLYETYPRSKKQPGYSVVKAMALIELEKRDEAITELKKDIHKSPQITVLDERLKLWKELQLPEEAENDITRVLDTNGSNTLVHYLRAELRCEKADFNAALQDYQLALKCNLGEPMQPELVQKMWKPLVVKYPQYAALLEATTPTLPPTSIAHDDVWIISVFPQVIEDLKPRRMTPQKQLVFDQLEKYFKKGDYKSTSILTDRIIHGSPSLTNSPTISLFRALLYKRLNQKKKVERELYKIIHKKASPHQIHARIALLSGLNKKHNAIDLLTTLINKQGKQDTATAVSYHLYRARLYILLNRFEKAKQDFASASKLAHQQEGILQAINAKRLQYHKLYPHFKESAQ